MTKKVVILTYSDDSPLLIDDISAKLEARGAAVLRFDTDRFPMEGHAAFVQDGSQAAIVFDNGQDRATIGPEDVMWYRRVRYAAKLPQSMDKQLRSGAQNECEALLRGLIAAAPGFVLDSPERVKLCGHKPRQQLIAQAVGLSTPRTLMTNDAAQAQEFLASCPHGAIAKMLAAFAVYDEARTESVVFTTALTEEHLAKLTDLRYCPMIFQERIVKHRELRVTVIGNRIFAAAIDSMAMPGAETDWRQKGISLLDRWTSYTLPPEVERRIAAYMDRIGMQYSALDFIVEPSGRHVFLEANPAGEFYWLQHNAPHFPLTEALADVLTDQPGARRIGHATLL